MKATPWMYLEYEGKEDEGWLSRDHAYYLCSEKLKQYFDLDGAKQVRLICTERPSKWAYKFAAMKDCPTIQLTLTNGRKSKVFLDDVMSDWLESNQKKCPYVSLEIE